PTAAPQGLGLGHAASRAHFGADILWSSVAFTEIEVGGNRGVSVVGEPPGTFAVPLIPSRRVMDNHHSGMGALPERPRVIGVDGITLVSLHGDGFRLHTFIIVGLVHSTLLVWIYV